MSDNGWFEKQATLAMQSIEDRPSWIKESYAQPSAGAGSRINHSGNSNNGSANNVDSNKSTS